MTIYEEIEDEYVRDQDFGVPQNSGELEELIGLILANNRSTTPEVATNVRLYFEATGTLVGLAEWYAARH